MKKMLIRNLKSLATPTGTHPKGGAAMGEILEIPHPEVLVHDGIIEAVGQAPLLSPEELSQVDIVDGEGMTLLPGFMDPHTHLIFGGSREEEFALRLRGESYMEIMRRGGGIQSTVRATREASLEELVASGRQRLKLLAAHGVTTVEAKSGYGLDKETELKQLRAAAQLQREGPLEVVSTFMGAHAVPPEYKGRGADFLNHLLEEVLPVVVEENLAEYADIFTEEGVFSVAESRHYLGACKAAGLKLKLHADEIVNLGGAALSADLGAVSADHLLKAEETGLLRMKEAKVVAVALPLTAFSLKEPYAPVRRMIDLGLPVALGTDYNPGSSYSCAIPLMTALATIHMGMTPEEALTAVTLNAAAALSRSHVLGTIEVGKKADFAFIDAPSYRFLAYHFGVNTVAMTMKNGNIIYRRSW